MRTTLTIDDDVAAALERLRKRRDVSFRDIVNDALRRGLRDLDKPGKRATLYRTRSVDLGGSRIGSLDNIGEVLALIEGEDHK